MKIRNLTEHEMEILTIKNAYDLIERVSKIYGYEVNILGLDMNLGEFKEYIDEFVKNTKFTKNEEYLTAITVNGTILLTEYDVLDADTINIYQPCKILHINK